MVTYRPELLLKLNSLINRYGSDEAFVANMHQWPRTIKDLVFNSQKLMTRFGLVGPVPSSIDDKTVKTGRES